MKKKLLSVFLLLLSLTALYAGEGVWTRADGEYFTRVVWHDSIEWTDEDGCVNQGMAYVGVYGTTYGLPSSSLAIKLYSNREDHLRGSDYRVPGQGAYFKLEMTATADGRTFPLHNYLTDDKIYLTGIESIHIAEILTHGIDVRMDIKVRDSVFTLNIPAEGFKENMQVYLDRKEFQTIGEWNVEKVEGSTAVYTSVTRYTNEDPESAIYFEIYGDAEKGRRQTQSVKCELYKKHHELSYVVDRTERSMVTYNPEKEWLIEDNIFGTAHFDPSAREEFFEAADKAEKVSLRVTDTETGAVYTVDFDPEEFMYYLSVPYGFEY